MIDLLQGDCLEVMRTLPDESVHACVTDPPYGLSFMGKKWDYDVPSEDVWREVLRILKPGGFLLSFSGTRTYHRMTVRIEDAGFEIRDMIQWLYGCLSDDSEILTPDGWVPYHKVTLGGLVCGYNVGTDELEWMPVEDLFVYDYSDTAYRLESDSTDQLVSRNHRCIVERGGDYVFQVAETLEREARVPVLENVRGLLDALCVHDKGTGSSEVGLLGGVRQLSDRTGEQGADSLDGKCDADLSGMRWIVPQAADEEARGSSSSMFASLPGETGRRPYQGESCAGTGGVVSRVGAGVPREDDRHNQSLMERRCDLLSETRQLQADQVRPMSSRISGNGPEGRVCDGASNHRGNDTWTTTIANGSGPSSRPRSAEQCTDESDAIREQPGPQAVRASRFTRSDLVRVSSCHYVGKVWCVQVRTGAFVARRNGKAFVTGNSGFPKSHDVSKAIDREAGAEREVIGQHERSNLRKNGAGFRNLPSLADESRGAIELTAPATDAAKQWEGWGTALKPSNEPICVARKPLVGTVAQNILAHGCGGLNIDACRVGCASDIPSVNATRCSDYPQSYTGECAGWGRSRGGLAGDKVNWEPNGGRWPANVVHDGSDEVLELFPQTGIGGFPRVRNAQGFRSDGLVQGETPEGASKTDAGSAARFFKEAQWTQEDVNFVRAFYSAKADRAEREKGVDSPVVSAKRTQDGGDDTRGRPIPANRNHHPTASRTTRPMLLAFASMRG